VPKNHLSYLVGRLSRLPFPRRLRRPLFACFARRFGVNLSEASRALDEYPSLYDFFVRDLRRGCRPISEGVVSPVDAVISEFGRIDDGRMLQVKNKYFSVAQLLQAESLSCRYADGYFITFYLAPGDYHHIHSPVDGVITEACYVPGKLWPVNTWSVRNIDGLFTVNERVITVIDSSSYGQVCVVKVGATNVGSIRLAYDPEICSNTNPFSLRAKHVFRRYYQPSIPAARGARLGTFCLGSTVILLFEAGFFSPGEHLRNVPVKMGERINAA